MPPMPEPDPLADLRARVKATQEAAETLAREASGGVPPAGWATPSAEDAGRFSEEVQAVAALLESLRELLPEELREQVTELVRQLLIVLRALIDWWVVRMEEDAAVRAAKGPATSPASPRGEEIPLD